MHFLGFILLSLGHLTSSLPVPVDTTIVQVQVGAQPAVQQVLLNGGFFRGTTQQLNNIIQTIMVDALPPLLSSLNQTMELRNHSVLRSRECILEGSQLHWTDRVFYDGKVHLTLDHTDTWTAHTPQAQPLKTLWEQDGQRTRMERIRLQEGCIKLMKELKLSEEQPVSDIPVPQFLIPVLAVLAFIGLIIISLFLSKNMGLRHPGGVIGSVIHYPVDMSAVTSETKGCGYRTL